MHSEFIKKLRKELKITQFELAVKIGVCTSAVYRWEKDISNPNNMARKAIKRILEENKWISI